MDEWGVVAEKNRIPNVQFKMFNYLAGGQQSQPESDGQSGNQPRKGQLFGTRFGHAQDTIIDLLTSPNN